MIQFLYSVIIYFQFFFVNQDNLFVVLEIVFYRILNVIFKGIVVMDLMKVIVFVQDINSVILNMDCVYGSNLLQIVLIGKGIKDKLICLIQDLLQIIFME